MDPNIRVTNDSDALLEETHEEGILPTLQVFEFDSILVDVPSTNDRISMNELSFDNVFDPIHTHVRQGITNSQKKLLKKAIQLCRPGGTVTYTREGFLSAFFMSQRIF